jgi:hypothetical protein
MEENDAKNNQDEKQNLEEEEYEEDEEEKEQEQNKEDAKEEAKDSKKENEQNEQIKENKENENDNPNQQKDEQKEEIKVKENEENQEKKEIVSQKNEKISDKTEQQEEKVEKIEENKTEEKKEEIKNIEENKLNEEIKNNDNDKKEDENGGAKNEEKEVIEEEEEDEEIKDGASTYILKYSRKSNEPRESSYDKELIKSKHCLFMIEFKLMQGKKEKYLLIYCHEIAAIYFDEIYEKKYSIKDLYKENRHFRIFDDVEEAKNIIDEILNNNTSNSKKIFIDLQENMFRLHLKMIFFDKECEIIFNIPKKDINDKERIRLLPGFLKEIQIRMNHLEDENKKLKIESKNMNDNDFLDNTNKNNLNEDDDGEFFGEKDEMNSKKNKSVGGRGYKKKMVKK